MPLLRIQLDADRNTARRVVELHRAGKVDAEFRAAAEAEVWRRGYTPAAAPVFIGITNGTPTHLIYDVEIYPDTTP
ncbi:hypothetical protein [Catenuloplanes atrovinosus]|uniref:Uncharacterized protein n=1 Tax=Catenuloplanes atrovinosus TaxID=137266 RepID=A0AAE3YVP2_9ACTN|nr:hypothetical protein [Catenuloplanes atrovinosus]MDR7280759.1 hypothetical protein [Catenuloplanes atrovinosus]